MGKKELSKIATICFALIPLALLEMSQLKSTELWHEWMTASSLWAKLIELWIEWISQMWKKQKDCRLCDGKIDRLLSISAFEEQGMAMPESYIEQEYNKKLINEFNGDRRLFRDVLRGNGQSQLEYRKPKRRYHSHAYAFLQKKKNGRG